MPNPDPPIADELLLHQGFLVRLAVDLVGEGADDLVQEVWRRALERPPHHARQLRGWLSRVARNLAANRWRDEARRREREERRGTESAESVAPDELETRFELRKELVEALDTLREPARETILLRYFEGLAPREIAARQGIPVATVKTRLRRGLAQMREAMDQRYEGDRHAWTCAVAALAAPGVQGITTDTLVLGGMAMGTMMKASVAVLAVAASLYFGWRTLRTESPRGAVSDGRAVAEVEERSLVTSAEPSGAALSTSTSKDAPEREPALTDRSVLRVVLEGLSEEQARRATVTLTGVDGRASGLAPRWASELRASWTCRGRTSEFDLAPFLEQVEERDGDRPIDSLEVRVDHPLHLIEWSHLPVTGAVEEESGATVYEVRARLVPACVIRGRLTRADGALSRHGLVGASRLEDDFPIEAPAPAVECDADGAFELRLSTAGRFALASFEEGLRPTTTRVDAVLGTRVDVGTLVLEPGHAITGHALRRGRPLAGATLSATPPTRRTPAPLDAVQSGMGVTVYEGRTFTSPARSVHLLWLPPAFTSEGGLGSRLNGRFELSAQRVTTDATGAFAFRGLGAGEYLLRMRGLAEGGTALPGYWDDSDAKDRYLINGDRPALVVSAPEHGLEFPFRWTAIRFELTGDLESESEGRLFLETPSGAPTPVDDNGVDLRLVDDPGAKGLNFTPAVLTKAFTLEGGSPTFVLQAPADRAITGEVSFPGRRPVALDFRTPAPGGELTVPVELVRIQQPATLVIELENPPVELPEAFSVELWRAGREEAPPDVRPVERVDGRLRVSELFPGEYRVRVRAGAGQRSAGVFLTSEFVLELPPGRVVTRPLRLSKGAVLRFTVKGEDGAPLGGEYEFFDSAGRRVDLNTHVLENKGWASSWKVFPHGIHESFNELQPGRYRLVLMASGHVKETVRVELKAGEVEELDVVLRP